MEFTLATFNCYWFFDDVAPFSKWGVRLPPGGISEKIDRLAQAILSIGPGGADVVALQEVENADLLARLVARLAELGSPIRFVFCSDTLDPATGQNVAVLSRFNSATRPVSRLDQTVRPYIDHRGFERIGSLGKFLRVDLEIGDQSLSVFVLHLKSQRGGTEETRLLRNSQTEIVRLLSRPVVEQGNSRSPSFVAILGDMNDVPQSRPIDTLMGKFDMSYKLISATEKLPPDEQWTYTYEGVRQQLDHILLNKFAHDRMRAAGFTRVERETSDHDAIWVRLDLSSTT
jgi:endonuclease/exonuclease/phosphatase family metal-dependent hydrolase